MTDSDWKIFRGTGKADGDISRLPAPPAWRDFRDDDQGSAELQKQKGQRFQARPEAIEMVNAALYLRRPLLITGNPGTGKSSLAYAVAYELKLGAVLKWAITTRTTLKDGLYSYDAIARLQDADSRDRQSNREQIGEYITLGALGTAFLASHQPRVLLIDEIDKSDIDLPNDLLNLFEDGEFAIQELQRIKTSAVEVRTSDRTGTDQGKATIRNGIVRCQAFPLVIMTSNNERDFPPPFLRRCLRLEMPAPQDPEELSQIVAAHLEPEAVQRVEKLITDFYVRSQKGTLATDQLLNAIYLLTRERTPNEQERKSLEKRLLQFLGSNEGS